MVIDLYKNNKREKKKVHRLVATAFIDNPNKLPIINHKNEIKDDNKVDNLEWCTYSYNNTYNNLKDKHAEKLSKKVYQYAKEGELIKIWKSTSECHKNKFDSGHVSACCRNCYLREGNNVYKGFIWSYEEIKKGE